MQRRLLAAAGVLTLCAALVVIAPGTASAATFTVDTTADDPAADCAGDNDCSLRGAVIAANAAPGADTITLAPTTYTLTVAGADEEAAATGDLDVTSDITITGSATTIDANDLDRIFDIKTGAALTISGLRVTDGTVAGGGNPGNSGGLVLNQGSFTASSSDLTNGSATRAGGAIEATNGSTTTLTDVNVEDNDAGPTPGNGGGFHLSGGGTVTITDSAFIGNDATNEGGGIWNGNAGAMTITDSAIIDNTALANGGTALNGGGGVFQQGGGTVDAPTAATGTLTISGSSILSNDAIGNAMSSGGGLLNVRGNVTVTDSEIADNSALRAGGGIETNGAGAPATRTALTRVDLLDNDTGGSPGNGGGTHLTGPGTTTVTDSLVSGNTADNEGGGLWNSSAGTLTVTSSEISGNVVTVGATMFNGGGGVFQQGGGTNDAPVAATGSTTITGSSIRDNSATGSPASSGGGVLNIRGNVTISGSEITGNSTNRAGGGIEANGNAVDPANTTLTGVLLDGNSADGPPGNGGGFHITGPGTTSVTESTVSNNTAANEGGGLWNSAAGTMSVTRSAVTGNVADGAGGDTGGGGLYNDGGTLDAFDSTVSGNTATAGVGGGALDVNGDITLIGVTVTENEATEGSGVFGFESPQVSTVHFGNSIIAGNLGDDCGGSLDSLGGNVLGEGCDDGADDTVTDDPELGPLADNGGPTLTHLPAQGSPAIDAGIEANCTDADQRGVARPIDGDGNGSLVCDAGAVEAAFIAAPANPGTPTAPGTPRAAPAAQPVTARPTFVG